MRLLVGLACAALVSLAASALADGDVAASVSGTTLTIRGDPASNWITITSGGATDAFTVTPSNNTTLNGAATAATFLHVRRFVLFMGAGDDSVTFDHVSIRGSVRASLDDGNDALSFLGTNIRGRVAVRGGAGTDTILVDQGAVFHGPLAVRGDAGDDQIQLLNSTFDDFVYVGGGADDDHVLVQNDVFGPNARLNATGGRGQDFVELVSCKFGNDVWIDLGPDDDHARLAGSSFALDASVYGGLGADDVLSIEAGNVFHRLQNYNGFEEGQPP